MKNHKKAIIVSLIICITSLSISIYIETSLQGYDYINGILIGVFSSAILILIQSIISYSVEKNKCITRIYETVVHYLNRIDRTQSKINGRKTDYMYLYDLVADSIDYYFVNFCDSIEEICLFINTGKLYKCIKSIIEDAESIYNTTKRLHSYIDDSIRNNTGIDLKKEILTEWIEIVNGDHFGRLTDNTIKLRKFIFKFKAT